MRMRRVPNHLQVKVIKWFDYLWLTQKCSDEEKAVSCLPGKYFACFIYLIRICVTKNGVAFIKVKVKYKMQLITNKKWCDKPELKRNATITTILFPYIFDITYSIPCNFITPHVNINMAFRKTMNSITSVIKLFCTLTSCNRKRASFVGKRLKLAACA